METSKTYDASKLLWVWYVAHDLSTMIGDEWTCDDVPGWLTLPLEDVGKTPGQLYGKYSRDGFHGFKVRRIIGRVQDA